MTQFHERLFPNQQFNSDLYKGDDFLLKLYRLLSEREPSEDDFGLRLEHKRISFEDMSTPPPQLKMISFLINLIEAKTFLEIGTFIGNTAMRAAAAMGQNGHVTTIEKFDEFAEIAQHNFISSGLSDYITLLVGDACELIKTLPDNHFDIIYLDGDKGRYLELAAESERILSDKGIIIIDDILFHGDALNTEPTTEKGRGCLDMINHYGSHPDFHKWIAPIGNGIMLLKRKSA